MKGRYEIRIYSDDIKKSVWCDTPTNLINTWYSLLETEEGKTYSVWDHTVDEIIIGSVFDPDDIDYINDYFNNNEE